MRYLTSRISSLSGTCLSILKGLRIEGSHTAGICGSRSQVGDV